MKQNYETCSTKKQKTPEGYLVEEGLANCHYFNGHFLWICLKGELLREI